MDNAVRGYRPDGGLGSLIVSQLLIERADPLAAFIHIPVEHLPEIQQAQYDILDRMDPVLTELKPTEPENLHLTLLYIEYVKDEKLEEYFAELNLIMPVAFTVDVTSSGTFPEADDKPVVLHVNPSPALIRLQSELYNTAFSLGLPISVFSKPGNYKPHITLAYGMEPANTPIPDLKEPITIPIANFQVTRPDYEIVRTIYLPTFRKADILVTQTDDSIEAAAMAGPSLAPEDKETDPRIAEMESGEPPVEYDISIRVLYDPDLDKEAQVVNTDDTLDITLGPPYYKAKTVEHRAGILLRMMGLDLARRMLIGPGGPHEWTRADAMMQAPPEDMKKGFKYVFGNVSLMESIADTYASLSLTPEEIDERGYADAARWIGYAVTEHEDFAPEELPDFREMAEAIGDMPITAGVTLLIERHASPKHPGTGTEQQVHAGDGEGGAGARITKEIMPARGDSELFNPGAPRTMHQDLTRMTDEQVASALEAEMKRVGEFGYEVEYRRDELLERSWELFESSTTEDYRDQNGYNKEQFINNWTRNIENAGGDPNPRYVLAVIRDLNESIEAGWMPVPTMPILIRRQNSDMDDSAQGQYQSKGKTGEGAFMEIFQDPFFQGDEPVSRDGTNASLMKWLTRSFEVESLDQSVGLSSQYFPSEMATAILHEEGHHWSDEHYGESMSLDVPEGRAFQLFQTGEGRERIREQISSYASEKPKEVVAEAYTIYHHPRYTQLAEERRRLIEHILFGEDL